MTLACRAVGAEERDDPTVYVAGGESDVEDEGEKDMMGEDIDVAGLDTADGVEAWAACSRALIANVSIVFLNGPGANSVGSIMRFLLSGPPVLEELVSVIAAPVECGRDGGGKRSGRRRSTTGAL